MLITHLDCLNLAHWLHNAATEDGLGPVCFAIVDAKGDLLWFERMDNTPAHSVNIAISKAYTASHLGTTTTQFHQRLEREKLSCSDFRDSNFTSMPGGSPFFDAKGAIVGAIGISGRTTEIDQHLADTTASYFSSLTQSL